MLSNSQERKIGAVICAGVLSLSSGAWAAGAAVKAVRIGEHPGKTRVVLDLSGPAQAQTAVSPDGLTLMIDLPGTAWKAAARQTVGKSPLLTGFESSMSPDGGSRLTLTAKAPISVTQSLNLKPDSSGGHRLVFDLAAGAAPAPAPVMMIPAQPAPAPVTDDARGVSAAPHISTLGFGHDFSYRINETAGVRISGNYFRLSRDTDIDGVNYKAEGELKSVGALADLYPFGGGFHVTGGVYLNMNEGKLTGTPTSSVTIGNNVYTPSQIGTLNGAAEFNRVAPYLGLGWKGTALHPNLMFGADLGVMYQGEAKVSLSSSGGTASSAAYAADLERERKNIEDELSKYRFFPVATISVGYKF
jgi:hypothetical protein